MREAYIAGPMTNRPGFNFSAFDAVAAELRGQGVVTYNPHERDAEEYPGIDDAAATLTGDVVALAAEVGFSLAAAMVWDLARVIESDAIVLLPEWETSSGARAERFVGEMTGSTVWLAERDGAGWAFTPDPVQKRLAVVLSGVDA